MSERKAPPPTSGMIQLDRNHLDRMVGRYGLVAVMQNLSVIADERVAMTEPTTLAYLALSRRADLLRIIAHRLEKVPEKGDDE